MGLIVFGLFKILHGKTEFNELTLNSVGRHFNYPAHFTNHQDCHFVKYGIMSSNVFRVT